MGGALWDCWVLRSGRRRSSQVHPVWIWPANPALLQVVVEDIDVDIDNGDGDSCDPPSPSPHACVEKVFYLILQHSGWGMVGPASRRANAWLVSSSRLSPTARCRCLFLLQSRLFQCNANLTDLVFWIVLDWVEWVNNKNKLLSITRWCVGVMAAWSWTSCASDFPLVFIASVRLIWYTWSLTPVTPPICNIGSIHVQGRSIELYFEHSAFIVALN